MIVEITTDGMKVVEVEDCSRLHVSTTLPRYQIDETLRSCDGGRLASDSQALLDLKALHTRARAVAQAPDWEQRWQAMVNYAREKGWLTPDGQELRAHLEP